MNNDVEIFAQKLNDLTAQITQLLQEMAVMRRNNPAVKAQTAKIMENQLIGLSRNIKQICKANNDDITAGISFLKIKMLG